MIVPMLLIAAVGGLAADDIVRAGIDVDVPTCIHYVAPTYPSLASRSSPPAMGIVALDVTLNEEGRPVDITVVRGVPLLDLAVIEAARQWRYAPTVVAGSPRRVLVRQVVDMFPDERSRRDYFRDLLGNTKETTGYRLLAIQRLKAAGGQDKSVLKALETATADADASVRTAAADALEALTRPAR